MAKLTRRTFLSTGAAAAVGLRLGPAIAPLTPRMRPILTLVYDKSLGAMRAVEKLVPY